MRKILLLLMLLGFWAGESSAQMQQGSWMMEGSVGLSRSKTDYPEPVEDPSPSTTYSFHPKVGYFLGENLAIGLSGQIGNTWGKNKDYNPSVPSDYEKGNTLNYGGGIFLRKYAQISENLSFFAELGSEFTWYKQKNYFNEPTGKTVYILRKSVSAQGILGLQYLISPKLGAHLQTNVIQYQKTQYPSDSGSSNSDFRAGFLLNPRFGLTLFL